MRPGNRQVQPPSAARPYDPGVLIGPGARDDGPSTPKVPRVYVPVLPPLYPARRTTTRGNSPGLARSKKRSGKRRTIRITATRQPVAAAPGSRQGRRTPKRAVNADADARGKAAQLRELERIAGTLKAQLAEASSQLTKSALGLRLRLTELDIVRLSPALPSIAAKPRARPVGPKDARLGSPVEGENRLSHGVLRSNELVERIAHLSKASPDAMATRRQNLEDLRRVLELQASRATVEPTKTNFERRIRDVDSALANLLPEEGEASQTPRGPLVMGATAPPDLSQTSAPGAARHAREVTASAPSSLSPRPEVLRVGGVAEHKLSVHARQEGSARTSKVVSDKVARVEVVATGTTQQPRANQPSRGPRLTGTHSPRNRCSICGVRVTVARMASHLALHERLDKPRNVVDPEAVRAVRFARPTGVRHRVAGSCAECGSSVEGGWLFESEEGHPVFVCVSCRPIVVKRSFGKVNPLDRTTGGAFESNRRRH